MKRAARILLILLLLLFLLKKDTFSQTASPSAGKEQLDKKAVLFEDKIEQQETATSVIGVDQAANLYQLLGLNYNRLQKINQKLSTRLEKIEQEKGLKSKIGLEIDELNNSFLKIEASISAIGRFFDKGDDASFFEYEVFRNEAESVREGLQQILDEQLRVVYSMEVFLQALPLQ